MKLSNVAVASLLVASASAFAPTQQKAFVRSPVVFMSEEDAPAPPSTPPESIPQEAAIVPIKEETVEFTAGLIGGAAGFAIGGPVLGAVGAAAANYIAKGEGEVAEVISAVSKTSIEIYNYLAKLDSKYGVLQSAQSSLEDALAKAKASQSDPATIEKVEKALASTNAKINEINDEYDLVGAGVTALGVCGDLVEKAISKAGELNSEYKLTEKASESLKTAVEKAKDAKVSMPK
mmetsp:Transcript_8802/g.12470  ORF Transcript_8802/g.12470 Transcript_8802/m.12470 type:complete len:234 (-) Transcript_8802:85-786(-)